ncbi:MAG: biotin--acetyl-CoA-carboxylase ligase, partial [Bifidobacterium adolescentis]
VPEDHLPTDKATSLQLVAHGLPDSMTLRDMIAAHLVDGLRSRLADFEADPHREATRAMEEMRPVCWTLGKPCEAHFVDGTTLRGTALELNPDASLTIRDDNGNLHTVRTADVGVLPQ